MNMVPVLLQMGMLFLVVVLGVIGAKTGCMDEMSNERISRLVLNLTLPCSVLYSVFTGERTLDNNQVYFLFFVTCFTAVILTGLAKIFICIFRIPAADRGISEFMMIFGNGTFMGYPVIRVIFGETAIFHVTIINMIFTIFSYTYGVILFTNRRAVFDMHVLMTPMVFSSILAFFIYIMDIRIPAYFVNVLGFVDQMTSPLSMMAVGCALAFVPLHYFKKMWRVYVMIGLRMLLVPIIVCLLLGLFVSSQLITGIITIYIAMPPAAATIMFAARYRGNQEIASSTVFISTLLSAVTIPVISGFLMFVSQ